jgi:putative transposase
MVRKPRFNLPGIPQHVIQRSNNRAPCFLAEADYRRYLDDLYEAAQKFHCKIHAYVLMTNHVHLLVTPFKEHGISGMMQALGRRYVYYINKMYKRTDTLWEGRYKSCLIDSDEYLLTCMRYIELNPVRATMVAHPGEYQWSSYANKAYGLPDKLIVAHPIYNELSDTEEKHQQAYRELFRLHLGETAVHDIRSALNQELVLGRNYFKDKIEEMTQRQVRIAQAGRRKVEEESGVYVVFR